MTPFLFAQVEGQTFQASPTEGETETQQPDEGEAPPRRPGGDGFSFIFPILIIFVVFFMLIQPQRKKEKQRRQMLEKIQRGDRVQTIGGIHGVVSSLSDDTAILTVDPKNNATLKVSRSAISRILGEGEEGKDEA